MYLKKELNEKVKKLGLTSSQCAVLDYLFHTSKDEISQRDVERHLSLKNSNGDRAFEAVG